MSIVQGLLTLAAFIVFGFVGYWGSKIVVYIIEYMKGK